MTTNGSPIVQFQGVTKVYKQGNVDVHALRGLDLSVEKGEFVAIWGPSGSGKTTALNLIGALDTPTKGSVTLEGKDLSTMSRWALSAMRRDRIGFVFQAYNLIPVLTAYENAEAVMSLQGTAPAERKARVMGLLTEVGLEGMEDRRPHELSGGQQQRVAIARAIASKPAVVLADEPTANVDSETAEKLLQIMAKLNAEQGVTFIFSTHDPRVMKYAKRLVGLVDGKVHTDVLKEQGAELLIVRTQDTGLHALHRAARAGDWDAIHACLSAGVDLELPADAVQNDKLLSHEGATALHFAAMGGHGELCARLIGRGAAVDARTAGDHTPLHYATWFANDPAVVGTLLGEGADPNAATWEGLTPLHYAARHPDVRVVILLLRRGAETRAVQDRSGMTALHVAALNGHEAVARVLVDKGVDGTVVDALGRTAADWARAQGYGAMARGLGDPDA